MHTPKTCDDCRLTWDRKGNVKDIVLCPLHRATPRLLEALEGLARLDQWRHSPEWLDNPSCRVNLNAAIDDALALITEMKGD